MTYLPRPRLFGKGSRPPAPRSAPLPPTQHPDRATYEQQGWPLEWLDKLDLAHAKQHAAWRAQQKAYGRYWALLESVLEGVPPEQWRTLIDGDQAIQEAWVACQEASRRWFAANRSLAYYENAPRNEARRIPAALKREVMKEWEASGRVCGICENVVVAGEKTHIHHISPLYAGGTSERANLTVAHAYCNWAHPKADPDPFWTRPVIHPVTATK